MGPRPIFGSKQQPAAAGNGSAKAPAAGSESDSEDDDDDDAAVAERAGKGTAEDSGDSDAEVDQRRLRMYERSKLRYYYAIVECDSVATAAHLYKQCDGLEFELTANRWGAANVLGNPFSVRIFWLCFPAAPPIQFARDTHCLAWQYLPARAVQFYWTTAAVGLKAGIRGFWALDKT